MEATIMHTISLNDCKKIFTNKNILTIVENIDLCNDYDLDQYKFSIINKDVTITTHKLPINDLCNIICYCCNTNCMKNNCNTLLNCNKKDKCNILLASKITNKITTKNIFDIKLEECKEISIIENIIQIILKSDKLYIFNLDTTIININNDTVHIENNQYSIRYLDNIIINNDYYNNDDDTYPAKKLLKRKLNLESGPFKIQNTNNNNKNHDYDYDYNYDYNKSSHDNYNKASHDNYNKAPYDNYKV